MFSLKHNKKAFTNRLRKEAERSQQQAAIIYVANALAKECSTMWTVKQVQDRVSIACGKKPSRMRTRSVLKGKLHMSYRKITRTPQQGNSERCKVLRSLWAKEFFKILDQGEKCIVIDETWLDSSDYRLRCWKKQGQLNTIRGKPMGCKVNLIIAMSTEGEVWASLL